MKRKIAFAAVFLLVLIGCAPKRPQIILPIWAELPAVTWESDGKRVCTSDYDALIKREQLRDLRERTYLEMLRALGAVDQPQKQ